MTERHYRIRPMHRDEVDLAIEWAAKEGWNPGHHDAACYFAADPNGFLIGLLDDEPIATISAIKYSDAFGFLGFYIVKPEYRGLGYGIQIWRAALEYLAGCNIGLDGVVAQQENYKKSGFKLAYRNVRYECVGGGDAPQSGEIIELASLPFDTVEAYDRPFFPEARSRFLQAWIGQPDCHALGMMSNDALVGYGVIRPCRSGYKIGPLFTDTPESAEALFLALKSCVAATETIYLDVPEVNTSAVALAERYGMSISFETARMYTGDEPELPLNCTYGVTSFEIG